MEAVWIGQFIINNFEWISTLVIGTLLLAGFYAGIVMVKLINLAKADKEQDKKIDEFMKENKKEHDEVFGEIKELRAEHGETREDIAEIKGIVSQWDPKNSLKK